MKIAVIGAGIAGLAAAYDLLANDENVTSIRSQFTRRGIGSRFS